MNGYTLASYPTLVSFLDKEPVATAALPIDDQGTIHAATMRFWHAPQPLKFYFVTDEDTQKCTLLKNGATAKGACVVGTYRGTGFTLQMRGMFEIADTQMHENEITSYYAKRGNRNEDIDEDGTILLMFTPSWARFTDYSKGYGHFMLTI